MFWSGTSGKALRGLEIGSFAVVDVYNNTAFSLEAIQSRSAKELRAEGRTMVNHYASLVIDKQIIKILNYIIFLIKKNFFKDIITEILGRKNDMLMKIQRFTH